jgi:TetR/AcrR family transcriptional regulator of autoinduction and epiphytic fitness
MCSSGRALALLWAVPRRRALADGKHRRILEAARVEFAAHGYHKTGVEDIVRRARVARGTFYEAWRGKRELFDAIVDELFQLVYARCRPIRIDPTQSVEQQVRGLIDDLCGMLIANLDLAKILLNEAVGLDAKLDAKLTGFYQRLLTLLSDSLAHGQAMGIVRAGDTVVLATCLVGCVKEALYQYMLGTRRPPVSQLCEELHRFVMRGVLA